MTKSEDRMSLSRKPLEVIWMAWGRPLVDLSSRPNARPRATLPLRAYGRVADDTTGDGITSDLSEAGQSEENLDTKRDSRNQPSRFSCWSRKRYEGLTDLVRVHRLLIYLLAVGAAAANALADSVLGEL